MSKHKKRQKRFRKIREKILKVKTRKSPPSHSKVQEHTDKKKRDKVGYQKHKNNISET